MLTVACGRGASHQDSTAGAERSAPADSLAGGAVGGDAVPAVARPPCPPTGAWAVCHVVERLERGGLIPRLDSAAPPTEPPLTPPGALVRVGNAELELYVYPDAGARAREQRLLDTARYVAFDRELYLRSQTTLIANTNLIAILSSRNSHLRERVNDAITAGPPQPAPTKAP